jgi:hypothetical protein
LCLYVTLLAVAHQSSAQSAMNSIGARAMGLGYASTTLYDEWAIHNNIAGLAKITQPAATFTYESNPSFPAFNRIASAFITPAKKIGTAGVAIYRFGDDLYNQQILTAGFANKMGLASLGIKINYFQYRIEGFGNTQALTVSLGGIAELTKQFMVGAYIVNINQPELSKLTEERIPTLLVLGLGFKPSEKLYLTTEIEKDLDYSLSWKSGIEYKAHKKFAARTGFNLNPQAGFAGLGFKPKKFQLDYAFQYHMSMGTIHQASVVYLFAQKK